MGKLSNFLGLFKRNLLSQNNNDKSTLNEHKNMELDLKDNDYKLNQIRDNENINILKEQKISNYVLNNTLSNESDFLKLFKYDSIEDSSKTFNIETALNKNWNKIDTFATNVSQQMEQKADKQYKQHNSLNTIGWKRIASCNNYNTFGTFTIYNNYNTAQPNIFEVSVIKNYGNRASIIQTNATIGGDNIISKIRIIHDNTKAYLEIYYTKSIGNNIYVTLENFNGWVLLNVIEEGSIPSGYNVQELTIVDKGMSINDRPVATSADLEEKADKVDERLNTTSKDLALAINETFQYANNGKTAIRTALSNKGVTVSLEDTFTLLAVKITAKMCKIGGTAIATDVLSGKTFINNSGEILTGTMSNRGAVTQALVTQGGQYTIPAGYHNGSGKVTVNISNLVASNIKKGVNAGGVVGIVEEGGLVHAYQVTLTFAQYYALPVSPHNSNFRVYSIEISTLPFYPKNIEVATRRAELNYYTGFNASYSSGSLRGMFCALRQAMNGTLENFLASWKSSIDHRINQDSYNIWTENNQIKIDLYAGFEEGNILEIKIFN